MKLTYWKGHTLPNGKVIRNFGDELNPYIFNYFLNKYLDDDETTALIGVGTLLNDRIASKTPDALKRVIFSSGYGYETGAFKLDDSFRIYCVRGPLTAKALGIDESHAITDGALLLRKIYNRGDVTKKWRYGFMPHWENVSVDFQVLCKEEGINYIDPTKYGLEQTFEEILSCDVLLAEAMHGAIVADALRVPWVPVKTTQDILGFKWRDWCSSMNLEYAPHFLPPIWDSAHLVNPYSIVRSSLKKIMVRNKLKKITTNSRVFLSDESYQNKKLEQLEECLFELQCDIEKGDFRF